MLVTYIHHGHSVIVKYKQVAKKAGSFRTKFTNQILHEMLLDYSWYLCKILAIWKPDNNKVWKQMQIVV